MTSVLLEKEKDTVIQDLLKRLCTNRGIDPNSLKVYDDVGKKVDTFRTVGESKLVFLELLDKKEKKKKMDFTKKKSDLTESQMTSTKLSGRPACVQSKPCQVCDVPLSEQLFPEELKALEEFKKQCENTKYFSDEFVITCLMARKFDTKRTTELIENNLKWRRENGLMTLPSIKELESVLEKMTMNFVIPGARDKLGAGITYMIMSEDMEMGKEPYTLNTMKKWIAWFYYIGIFHDGIDSLRNGMCIIEDLTGFGWKHFDVDFQKQMSSIWVDTFPLRVKRLLVLNPPVIFGALVKILKTFFKGKMLDRIEVVDKPKDLRKWVTEDQLSGVFGGAVQYDHKMWVKDLRAWAERNEERLRAPGRE